MRKVILTSHGHLAEGMQSAIRMIVGERADLTYYDLDHYEEPDVILQMIRQEVESFPETEYVIFTDINNGSVHHQMMQLCVYRNVYVQTGMSLSMVLELLLCDKTVPMEEAISRAVRMAKENMQGFHCNTIKKEQEEELW